MLNLNVLLHEDLEVVGSIIDSKELTNCELRAVLQNIIRRVVNLEERVNELEYKSPSGDW